MAISVTALGIAGVVLCQIVDSQGQAQETCGEERFICQQGHCCSHGRCCTNYYELWGFWVLWVTVALLVGCCYYQQKRLRRQAIPFLQRTHRARRARANRRNRSRSRSRTRRSTQPTDSTVFLPPVFDPDKMLRLPTYEEVKDLPKDPPAYSIIFRETVLPQTAFVTCTTGGSTSLMAPEGHVARVHQPVGTTHSCDNTQTYLLPNEVDLGADSGRPLPRDDPPPYPATPPQTHASIHTPSLPCDEALPRNESTDRLSALFLR